ncbi:LacI family transcriptional regulator [Kushneria sinocarnis]|uniref:LacI family transcriptional regulator n=1 Tax=Kushneria sinocarnis TaxID=595502 RepID=A0A420X0M9_9GAMM|nr:substrate-binding domain-containing protein [Kushneria sinocarnis]RKR07403.1 LacI family transcriptional regulator [Kushneria sinocarnis]
MTARQRRVTASEVARAARVAVSTVSRALRDDHRISAATRHHVQEVAQRLGYESATRRSSAPRVGLVMEHLHNPFYPALIERLSHRLAEEGVELLCMTAGADGRHETVIASLARLKVGAIIFTTANIDSAAVSACEQHEIPAILVNRYIPGARALTVGCNNYAGGMLLAEWLIRRGHRRLLFIQGERHASTTIDRQKGVRDAARRYRLPAVTLAGSNAYSHEAGYTAIGALARHELPDAIIGANDVLALGAMDALCHEWQLAVPEAVSVAGFDDIDMAAWRRYDLTTVRQPLAGMVEAVVEGVHRSLKYQVFTPRSYLLEGDIIERGSVATRPATMAL